VRTLVWSQAFKRAFRRQIRHQPVLRVRAERILRQLAIDPFEPSLHSHKLKGELAGVWSCMVDYDNRILFEFVRSPDTGDEKILLLSIGTHDEVY
jgi:mRNA-degrading endonuclease YafQ of YafQ-DinJ toxin-antitoxin module